MSGTSKNIAGVDEARLSAITNGPLPASRKVHVRGSMHPFLRVPLREIAQTTTHFPTAGGGHTETPNPPVAVYDTSGPYTDPDVTIDARQGLAATRLEWIKRREDVDELPTTSSAY